MIGDQNGSALLVDGLPLSEIIRRLILYVVWLTGIVSSWTGEGEQKEQLQDVEDQDVS